MRLKEDEAGEVLYRAVIKPASEKLILQLREEFSIPTNGFKDSSEESHWFKSDRQRRADFVFAMDDLTYRLELPFSLRFRLEEYVLGGINFKLFAEEMRSTCAIDHHTDIAVFTTKDLSPTEEEWRRSGKPYVKVYISDYTNSDEVKRFITSKWSVIRGLLDKQRNGKRPQVHSLSDKEYRREAYELSLLRESDLKSLTAENLPYGYTTDLIARIINERHSTKFSGEKVKAFIASYKKLISE